MAEYCPKCATKYGMEPESDFGICEGCGEKSAPLKWWWVVVFILLGLALIW